MAVSVREGRRDRGRGVITVGKDLKRMTAMIVTYTVPCGTYVHLLVGSLYALRGDTARLDGVEELTLPVPELSI